MPSFKEFPLLPSLLSTLDERGFSAPTAIQQRSLPALLRGESLAGVAETGSGKTLAYILPVLHTLKSIENEGEAISEPGRPRALVLVPASDLGEQVARAFKGFTHDTRLRVRSALGGMKMAIARKNVSGPFEVLLATPGRLEQLLQLELVSLSDIRFLVIDEADQMLDAGFLPVIKRVLHKCPADSQRALFTATASDGVQSLMQEMFRDTEIVETRGRHRLVPTLMTRNLDVPNGNRLILLENVLQEEVEGGTLIFANTRDQCDRLAEELQDNGYPCAIYRGDMDKKERRKNLKDFREGKLEILISTDLASRGLDIENIDRVINVHLPREMNNYLHRAGRTARAGRKGTVINFVTDRDNNLIKRLNSIQAP